MVNSWEEVGPNREWSNFENQLANTFLMPQIQDRSKKNLMEALKSLSSRAQNWWTHQGNVQFHEPTYIHLNYASYPEESSKHLMKVGKFPYF